ncbi:MAG TPA: ATP-binding protein [Verrucomicrobiae bacterium]|jgi:signal transduction histidine kinase
MEFRNFPIKRKLTAVIMLTSTVVLALTAAAFIVYEIENLRHNLRVNSEAIAIIAAEESSAAAAAGDGKTAGEVLANFSAKRQILLSALYGKDGAMLAHYPVGVPVESYPSHPPQHGYDVIGRAVNIFEPVSLDNKPVGVMYLKYDLSQPYQRFAWYAGLMAMIFLGSVGIALVMSNWLQGLISAPILELAETAKAVAFKKDYRVRAAKFGGDELGVLTDAFNHMLTQIHDRDAALSQSEAQLRQALQAAEASAAEVRVLNAELELRVKVRTAELAAANQELEAFTYSVSHDLRAPLRHIDAYAQILDEEHATANPTQLRHYLSRIRHGAQNMGRLVDDLLNLARVGRTVSRPETIDLNQLVEEVRSELRLEINGRQIEWRVGKLPEVHGSAGLIKQVFANLISNSVKYTRPRPAAVIEIGQEPTGDGPAIFIRDNGVGFNMQYVGKLFGVFQRLHAEEEFEGTGVGLATVKRIVQMEGGRIWAQSELDKGATFRFTLNGMNSNSTKT